MFGHSDEQGCGIRPLAERPDRGPCAHPLSSCMKSRNVPSAGLRKYQKILISVASSS